MKQTRLYIDDDAAWVLVEAELGWSDKRYLSNGDWMINSFNYMANLESYHKILSLYDLRNDLYRDDICKEHQQATIAILSHCLGYDAREAMPGWIEIDNQEEMSKKLKDSYDIYLQSLVL